MNRYLRPIARILACASLMALQQPAHAATQRVVCPKEIPEASIQLVDTPKGWKPYKSFPLKLNSAAPTAGAPELKGDLAEFTTKQTKTTRTDTYDLSPPHPGGVWMKCGYGASNEITLHKQLEDTITQCTITQKIASPADIEIQCK